MNAVSISIGAATAGGAAFGLLAWVSASPGNQFWGKVYTRSEDRSARGYALTFDDGPTAPSTAAILDLLGELNAPAAFFVVGSNARRSPDLLRRMDAEGHLIANHSFNHDHFSMFRGRRYWERELAQTDHLVEQTIGRRPALFRPPMGVKTCFLMEAAAGRGQAVVTWSRRGIDGITTTPRRILGRLGPHTRAGDIIALHDGVEPHGRRDPTATVSALKPLVVQLRDRGLNPVRLNELLKLPAYAAEPSESPVGS